jgi:hypothetical protein
VVHVDAGGGPLCVCVRGCRVCKDGGRYAKMEGMRMSSRSSSYGILSLDPKFRTVCGWLLLAFYLRATSSVPTSLGDSQELAWCAERLEYLPSSLPLS